MAFDFFGASRMNSPWTTKITVRMIELWEGGMSAAKIAKEIGIETRNAVIGKVHRMGLQRNKPSNPSKPPKPSKPTVIKVRVHVRKAATPVRVASRLPRRIAKPPKTVRGSTPRLWTTRKRGECAFPVSGDGADTYSCCAPIYTTLNFPYCKAHLKVMTQPRNKQHR
jgi:GcrA cell cycle regulator